MSTVAAPEPGAPRLRLRRFSLADLDLLDRLNGDPETMRYMGGPMSRARSEAMLRERILEDYERFPGLGIWATVERTSGECVGMHVLNHIQGETDVQIGYRLFPRYWGRGYATEMSVALIRYGFVELGLDRIAAIADPGNLASHRILEKCRLRRRGERRLTHPAYAASGPLVWFEVDAESWLAGERKRL